MQRENCERDCRKSDKIGIIRNMFVRQIVMLRNAVIIPEFKMPRNICFSDNLMIVN